MSDKKPVLIQVDAVTNAEDITALSCADVLGRREHPVALFTPALLVTHGGFDRDPVVEFNALCPAPEPDLKPFVVDLKKDNERFFCGLGLAALPGRQKPVDFDRRLYAIDARRAAECFDFINGIAFSEPKTQFFAQTCSYDITVPDPTSKKMQFLRVRVFGVVANTFIAVLQARKYQPPLAVKAGLATPAEKTAFLNQLGIVGAFDGVDPLQDRA